MIDCLFVALLSSGEKLRSHAAVSLYPRADLLETCGHFPSLKGTARSGRMSKKELSGSIG